jgi:hypothetical protein
MQRIVTCAALNKRGSSVPLETETLQDQRKDGPCKFRLEMAYCASQPVGSVWATVKND